MKTVHEPYRTPFDWDTLLAWLGARAIPGVELVENGVYQRGEVRVWHMDDTRPRVSVTGVSETGEGACLPKVRRLFDLDADPDAIANVLGRDKLLRFRKGLRVPGAWDSFELAVRAIVGQQVSVAGARTILGRIAAKHGLTPEALSEVDVAGMPRKRAETIRSLAAAVRDGHVDLAKDDLTKLPGIGPWTAQYIAMRLGDADAFPAGDLVLRRNAGNLTERELLKRAESWRPYRAYAAMALWLRHAASP